MSHYETRFSLEQAVWFTGPETEGEFLPAIVRGIALQPVHNQPGKFYALYDLEFRDDCGELARTRRIEHYIGATPDDLAGLLVSRANIRIEEGARG